MVDQIQVFAVKGDVATTLKVSASKQAEVERAIAARGGRIKRFRAQAGYVGMKVPAGIPITQLQQIAGARNVRFAVEREGRTVLLSTEQFFRREPEVAQAIERRERTGGDQLVVPTRAEEEARASLLDRGLVTRERPEVLEAARRREPPATFERPEVLEAAIERQFPEPAPATFREPITVPIGTRVGLMPEPRPAEPFEFRTALREDVGQLQLAREAAEAERFQIISPGEKIVFAEGGFLGGETFIIREPTFTLSRDVEKTLKDITGGTQIAPEFKEFRDIGLFTVSGIVGFAEVGEPVVKGFQDPARVSQAISQTLAIPEGQKRFVAGIAGGLIIGGLPGAKIPKVVKAPLRPPAQVARAIGRDIFQATPEGVRVVLTTRFRPVTDPLGKLIGTGRQRFEVEQFLGTERRLKLTTRKITTEQILPTGEAPQVVQFIREPKIKIAEAPRITSTPAKELLKPSKRVLAATEEVERLKSGKGLQTTITVLEEETLPTFRKIITTKKPKVERFTILESAKGVQEAIRRTVGPRGGVLERQRIGTTLFLPEEIPKVPGLKFKPRVQERILDFPEPGPIKPVSVSAAARAEEFFAGRPPRIPQVAKVKVSTKPVTGIGARPVVTAIKEIEDVAFLSRPVGAITRGAVPITAITGRGREQLGVSEQIGVSQRQAEKLTQRLQERQIQQQKLGEKLRTGQIIDITQAQIQPTKQIQRQQQKQVQIQRQAQKTTTQKLVGLPRIPPQKGRGLLQLPKLEEEIVAKKKKRIRIGGRRTVKNPVGSLLKNLGFKIR